MSKSESLHMNALVDLAMFSSAEELADLLDELNTQLPRTLRIEAMRDALAPYFKTELKTLEHKTNALESHETKRLEYLKSTSMFTEMQLREALNYYHDQKLLSTYYRLLWNNILNYLENNGAYADYLKAFFTDKMRNKHADDLPHHEGFNSATDSLFYDEHGMLDGLTFDQIRRTLYNSATKNLIIATGKKYGFDIVKTMNKQQMRKLIKTMLTQRNEWEETLTQTLEEGSIKTIEDIAAHYQLPIRSYLTKEDMIEQLIIHVKYQQDLLLQQQQEESTEAYIKRLEEEVAQLKQQLQELSSKQSEEITQASHPIRNKVRLPILDIIAASIMGFLFLGLMSYFLSNMGMFATINNLINQVTYRETGIMDIYHNVIDFIIRG